MGALPLKSNQDFSNYEALNMRLHNSSADPSDALTGFIYYNTASNKAKIFTGGGFKTFAFIEDFTALEDLTIIQESIEDLEKDLQELSVTVGGKQSKITSSNKLSASLVSDLATVATSGSYNDLSNKPTIPSAVTESTVSGWGFTKNTGTYSKPSTGIPKTDLASAVQTSLGKADTALQSSSNAASASKLKDNTAFKAWDKTFFVNGVPQEISGNLNIDGALEVDDDLYLYGNLRFGEDELSLEEVVESYGFTKSAGAGTITGVSANGTSIATSGVANIPAASTSKYGVTKLSSSTSSTSTSLAATASAVKSAYDLANGKQDKLTSGTNIKTINGTSILGSGDITISAGGGGTITGIKMNGASKGTSGVVDLGTVITPETASSIKSNSVICGTKWLRVNAGDSANNYGYIRTETVDTNRGLVHIGSNYGGSSDYTVLNNAVDAIGMYRGVVGIGQTWAYADLKSYYSAGTKLVVAGNINATGTVTHGSDIRFKDYLEDAIISVHDIAAAPLFKFKWNDREDKNVYVGSSAQYWGGIMSELVRGEDFKTLDYSVLGTAIGISLAKKILELETKVATLEDRIKELTK